METNGKIRAGDIAKGAAAGLVGGLVASFVMNEFQALWTKLSNDDANTPEAKQQEPATVKAAEMVTQGTVGHQLTEAEKEYAGPAVHYAMGGTSGAIYGAMSELMPAATTGAGLPFGAAVWLVADEIAVPALGLSRSPAEYPLSTHGYALVSHLVYGLTTEAVRRAARSIL